MPVFDIHAHTIPPVIEKLIHRKILGNVQILEDSAEWNRAAGSGRSAGPA